VGEKKDLEDKWALERETSAKSASELKLFETLVSEMKLEKEAMKN